MNDEEQIREIYRRYWQYMIDKDADGLRSIIRRQVADRGAGFCRTWKKVW